jgi:uncharacterized protein YbjT (DUF2867 family)
MILVVGASGVLGQKVVRLLLAEGHRVRAMTRDRRNALNLESQGAEVCVADLVDHPSLARACQGVSHVVAAAHAFMGRGRYNSRAVDDQGHKALIDAARGAGVHRFAYVSAMGAAPDHAIDFYRTKYDVERYLERSGLEHVIVRPSAFMEWHAHKFNGANILKTGRTTLIGSGRKPRNFVAASDVAWIVARTLTAEATTQRIMAVGGPGNFSNEEVARLYARVAGIDPKIRYLPRAIAAGLAVAARPFHPGVARVLRLSSLPDDAFSETFDAEELVREYRLNLTTLEDFVREQVKRWRADAHAASAQLTA